MTRKFISAIFVSIFLLSLVSSLSISNVNLGDVTQSQTVPIKVAINNFLDTNTYTVNFTSTDISLPNTAVGNNSQVNVSTNYAVPSTLGSRSFTVNYQYTNTSTISGSFNVTMNVVASTSTTERLFCPRGEIGSNLSIDNVDLSSSGEDDDEWKYFDEVTVEVRVRNTGNDEVENVVVELGIFDSSGKEYTSDLEFSNDDEDQIEVGDLDDGDRETVTFEFRVPADFESGDYRLAVRAVSDDISDQVLCADESSDLDNDIYESVSVEEEDDEGKFIGFDNVELSSSEFTCSESGSVSFEVFNIGEDDQDRVLVTLYNDALNIEESYEIKTDFDVGDNEDVAFDFTLPSNAKDGNYQLHLTAEYDYRSGNYRQDLDEEFDIPITLMGCSITNERIATISAVSSEVEAGNELVVDATIRNLASEELTFVIDAEDYNSWADLVDISDRTITLGAGETQSFTVTLNVNDDAEASEIFTIVAMADGESESREVSVDVVESKGLSFGGSSFIWIIAAINLVLIILIILVAVKLSKR